MKKGFCSWKEDMMWCELLGFEVGDELWVIDM